MRTRSFRLSDGLDEALVVEAARVDRSVSWLIVRALEQALSGEPLVSPVGPGLQREAASARASAQGLEQALSPEVSSGPSPRDESRPAGPASSTAASARAPVARALEARDAVRAARPDRPVAFPAPSKAPGGYVRLLNPRPKGLR